MVKKRTRSRTSPKMETVADCVGVRKGGNIRQTFLMGTGGKRESEWDTQMIQQNTLQAEGSLRKDRK